MKKGLFRRRIIKPWMAFLLIAVIAMSGFTAVLADQLTGKEDDDKILEPDTVTMANLYMTESAKALMTDQEITSYKDFLINNNIQSTYQKMMDEALIGGSSVQDIEVAYEYLAEDYAEASWLLTFLNERSQDTSWSDIFANYVSVQGEFVPSSFDQDYIEELMEEGTLTSDDIMICDHIAFSTDADVEQVIDERLEGYSIKQICLDFNSLGNRSDIPHVQITMSEWSGLEAEGYSDDMIEDAYVLADEMDKEPQEVLDLLDQGVTVEKMMADYLTEKYQD